ncbi:protein FRA10AC1 isoform X1 [Erinaceus europaeus]|uniref:Protein FRA10AC1 isoform X1 n=1 Tax=Erinaceus europaeus TaxID=9365 RepID=A0ABM3XH21_ERIEU|nr:protein FRA10AC1 isoform X1 [Erinaceus europaeus]XP_060048114.1 protein FRA10AC1 isoform X1 [Erinaceus europaeus]XP_060048118.1 protein FRA10AC1 isoform X1 [Erinaceus europaeus]XP_060048121.1 protein FRA10AC1 isoform X1 [Erinaceus europaeus]
MHGHGDYDSDFSDDEHCGESRKGKKKTVEDDLLLKKPFQKEKHGKVAHKQVAAELLDREEARNRRFHLIAMDAYQRHTKFVNDYILYYGGKKEDFRRVGENDKTDMDVIRENHRFLWNEEDEMDMNWEKRLAKKYYDKLFKEYCIADLSRYKENKFGFRWRIEKEVISGKGQFFCGNKCCDEKEGLKSWEVNFGYIEHGEKRNALVKLREKKSSQKKERIKPIKITKSHHIKDLDYHLQKRQLRKRIKDIHPQRNQKILQVNTLMKKKVPQNLSFGKAHYQRQMKNHRKKNLMIIFKIYFCEMEKENEPTFLDVKVYFKMLHKNGICKLWLELFVTENKSLILRISDAL